MQVNASIDESDVGMIRNGQSVTFRVGAFPDRDFTGIVRQLRLNPTVAQNVVTYTAVIDVMNDALKPAAAHAATSARQIWAQAGGGFIRIPVQTGLSDGANTELLSGDLVEGMKS